MLESRSFNSPCYAPGKRMQIRALPKVFHTCGKNCGKSGESASLLSFRLHFARLAASAKVENHAILGLPSGSILMSLGESWLRGGRRHTDALFFE